MDRNVFRNIFLRGSCIFNTTCRCNGEVRVSTLPNRWVIIFIVAVESYYNGKCWNIWLRKIRRHYRWSHLKWSPWHSLEEFAKLRSNQSFCCLNNLPFGRWRRIEGIELECKVPDCLQNPLCIFHFHREQKMVRPHSKRCEAQRSYDVHQPIHDKTMERK